MNPSPTRSSTRQILALLSNPLRLLAAWTALFLLMRLLLLGATWSHAGATPIEMAPPILLRGLRFDLSMAAKIVGLFGLWLILRPHPRRWEVRLRQLLFGALSLAGLLVMVAEVEYYKEFQIRIGQLAIEYFSTDKEHNATILGMIWHGYPVVRWLLFWALLGAAFLWLTRRLLAGRTTPAPGYLPRAVALLLWLALVALCGRGGPTGQVLRWGDAYWSPNPYVNQMTENPLFNLAHVLWQHAPEKRKGLQAWRRDIPLPEAIRIVREQTLLPGERLVAPEEFPLLRTTPASTLPLRRPRNVVVVIMESFSGRFTGALGAGFGATPNFDRLASEGILFDRFFSAGTHTAQGVFATLCSFPNLPDLDGIMKEPTGRQRFRALPRLFQEAGFSTLFLYNGLFSWDNKQGFFREQGVEHFVGKDDYIDPLYTDPDWGVSDQDLFNRAAQEFSSLHQSGKPFLGILLTLSNHAPFNLPPVAGLERIGQGDPQEGRLNGIHYADWALGQFMEQARRAPWFDDTLFVFLGDHGFGMPPTITGAELLHMHVPLLVYGPSLLGNQGQVRHVTAGQLDLLPSLVALAGIDRPHQSFGRNLFALPPDDPGHAYVKRSGDALVGWIEGDKILVAGGGTRPSLSQVDLGFPPSAGPDLSGSEPEQTAAMLRRAKATITLGGHLLEQHKAGPAAGSAALGPRSP